MIETDRIIVLLHSLMGSRPQENTFKQALDEFLVASGSTQEIASAKIEVAEIYYQLLRQCQMLYTPDGISSDHVPVEVQRKLCTVFRNISQLTKEMTESERRSSSYLQVIWFLNEIYTEAMYDEHRIERTALIESSAALLEVLNDISFVFDMKENGSEVFPINRTIADVISGHDFIEGHITTDNIRILQLAVRLFKKSESELETLSKLRNDCNLAFLDYLNSESRIIDTKDFLNYSKNRTMIFYRSSDHSVLVRNETKEYFAEIQNRADYQFGIEKDSSGEKEIGAYIIFTFGKSDVLTCLSEALERKEGVQFLRLLFDKDTRNILMSESVIRRSDGSFAPINPCCKEDKYIIRETETGTGRFFHRTKLLAAIEEYRLAPICQNNEYPLNRLTFGLCVQLLDIANTGVDSLGLNKLSPDSWMQTQVLDCWMQQESVTLEQKEEVFNAWRQQLEYCQKEGSFSEEKMKSQDFLPFSYDALRARTFLFPEVHMDELLFLTTLRIDRDVKSLDVSLLDTEDGKAREAELGALRIPLAEICDFERWNNEGSEGAQYYVFYSLERKTGHIVEANAAKIINGLEEIWNTCTLPYAIGRKVSQSRFRFVTELTSLYKEAFEQAARSARIRISFDDQVALRLLHNLIFLHIQENTVDDYFGILSHHEVADFEGIDQDPYFRLDDPSTLYVPKDSSAESSVLADLYKKELNTYGARAERILYDYKLSFDEKCAVYTYRGQPVKRLVFMTDNFLSGYATRATVGAYLGIKGRNEKENERIRQAEKAMHRFLCDGKELALSTLLETNAPVSIQVYGYYGTESGALAIDEFLKPLSYLKEKTAFAREINATLEDIREHLKNLPIYTLEDGGVAKNKYLVFRRYSMPKFSVFPKAMLQDYKRWICLFVQRREHQSIK